jgi:MinD-like ATPase involved in chromosome partitioning or flagellar assembly
VFSVAGTKGGCGKSTTAMSLSIWLSRLKPEHWVLLIDGDLYVRTVQLKLCQRVEATLADVLRGKEPLERSVHLCDLVDKRTRQPIFPNLAILPASKEGGEFLPEITGSHYDYLMEIAGRFDDIIKQLRERFSYIIIDTPASFSVEHLVLTGVADAIIYVTTPERDSIEATKRTADGLRFYLSLQPLGTILNRLPRDADEKYWVKQAATIAEVLGVVPDDPKVEEAFRADFPVVVIYPKSSASLAFFDIAKRIADLKIPAGMLSPRIKQAVEIERLDLARS